MPNLRRLSIAGAVAIMVISTRLVGQGPAAPAPAPESIQGMLADGSNYRAVKPTPWNGTLVLDLDFANNLSAPPGAIERTATRSASCSFLTRSGSRADRSFSSTGSLERS